MDKIAFDMALSYASVIFADEIANNKIKLSGIAPEDIDQKERFIDLVEDAYKYYQNCEFDFND